MHAWQLMSPAWVSLALGSATSNTSPCLLNPASLAFCSTHPQPQPPPRRLGAYSLYSLSHILTYPYIHSYPTHLPSHYKTGGHTTLSLCPKSSPSPSPSPSTSNSRCPRLHIIPTTDRSV